MSHWVWMMMGHACAVMSCYVRFMVCGMCDVTCNVFYVMTHAIYGMYCMMTRGMYAITCDACCALARVIYGDTCDVTCVVCPA